MTGGIDWRDLADPLAQSISPLQGFVMVLYIAFTVLALTNVVTGVFVEGALKSARQEEEAFMVERLHTLFQETDAESNGSGKMSIQQFKNRFESEEMRDYLESMNVNPAEAASLVEIIDSDESGTIDYDEFVGG